MKVRVTGSPAECEQLLERLARVLQVREVSGFHTNRPPSVLGRVYLDVELPDATEQTPAVRTDTGPVSLDRAVREFLVAWDDVGASWQSLEAPVAAMRRALGGDR